MRYNIYIPSTIHTIYHLPPPVTRLIVLRGIYSEFKLKKSLLKWPTNFVMSNKYSHSHHNSSSQPLSEQTLSQGSCWDWKSICPPVGPLLLYPPNGRSWAVDGLVQLTPTAPDSSFVAIPNGVCIGELHIVLDCSTVFESPLSVWEAR